MAKELILISHGKLAEEAKKGIELIMGPQDNIQAVCMLPEDGVSDFQKKFEDATADFSVDDIVVFADLMGGTPANTVSRLIKAGLNIKLYAGLNMAMIMEWLNCQMVDDRVPDYV
ncbi:MAG: PTS sugar transporter subunit IIA, partial [Lactobacillus iners]